ncbi:MAG: DUF6777 domain-containing protein [Microthrixaceae bacterium]
MLPQSPQPTPTKPNKTWPLALSIGVVMLLIGGVGGFLVRGSSDDGSGGEGEVFMEPANEPGADSFSSEPLVPAVPVSWTEQAPANSATGSVPTNSGREPGLYGGSTDNTVCDPQKMIDFLAANPDKAAAWVSALNGDPDVVAVNGSPLTVDTMPAFIRTLTPVVLNSDTRVTNYGYRNGQPTPRQSVLQKGSAVLIDQNGIPRVRCYCGNPLTAPVATKSKPMYVGGNAGWKQPVNPGAVLPPKTKQTGPFQVTPPGQPGGPLTQLSPPLLTQANTTTTTTTTTPGTTASTTSPPTTAAPSTTTPANTNGPTVTDPKLVRDPVEDANCTATYGPGSVGSTFTASWTDPQGDAVVLVGDFGNGYVDVTSSATFASTGTGSGTVTASLCAVSGDTVKLQVSNTAGNPSNEIVLTAP